MFGVALPEISGITIGVLAFIAGIIIFASPHILNYLVGGWLLLSGIIWLVSGAFVPALFSIGLGIIILLFPHFINYLIGIYLLLLGIWFIFAGSSLIVGLITLAIGILVLAAPDILTFVVGGYLVFAGIVAVGHYLHLF